MWDFDDNIHILYSLWSIYSWCILGEIFAKEKLLWPFMKTFNLSDDRLFSLIYKHLPWVQTARNSSTKLIDAEIDHTNYYANRFYRLNYQSLSARLIELVLSVNEPRSVVRHNCPCDVICGVIIFHYLNALFFT